MDILNGLDAVSVKHRGSVLTIGNFDGVHIGHRKTLWTVLEKAHFHGAPAMAITFEPHPLNVLSPERGVGILTPPKEKARLMKHYGMDILLFIKFDYEFSRLSAEEFIEQVLVRKLGAISVIVGHNYAFGKGKKGTTGLLKKWGRQMGFDVAVVRNIRHRGDTVSSSRIRNLITRGRVKEASALLGRPYVVEGGVVKGAGRGGSILKTPTANISTAYEIMPKEGVYAVRAKVGNRFYNGAANIGPNPTFTATAPAGEAPGLEVHLLRFKGEIIGETVRVYFIDRIRDEKKFHDAASLKSQIEKDIETARNILDKKDIGLLI